MITKHDMTALIVVDPQMDFCVGGTLAVQGADTILMEQICDIADKYDYVVISQDWHPPNHSSFVTNGGPWPVHCIAASIGATVHPALRPVEARAVAMIHKGRDPKKEAYSAFDDTGLAGLLTELNVSDIDICGLALDYCVKATALGAHESFQLGEVRVLIPLTRYVAKETTEEAIKELEDDGVTIEGKI